MEINAETWNVFFTKSYRSLLTFLLLANVFFLSAVIAFQITKKGEMITVPNLYGMSFPEARKELSKLRVSVIQVGIKLHDDLEQGLIISQEPANGSKIKLNQVVRVVVSAGKKKIIVPDLTGRTLESIPTTFQEIQLRKGRVSHVHTSKYAAGKIISQYPSAGQEVGINSKVDLLVSQGEWEKKYLMPDLLGKRSKIVIAVLRERGFRVGDIRRSYYPGLESGIIIDQIPKPGDRIQKRNIIRLEVSN